MGSAKALSKTPINTSVRVATHRAAGFEGRSAPVASSRLIDAVAASLALGALSLCLVVALTLVSIKVGMAMPIPA